MHSVTTQGRFPDGRTRTRENLILTMRGRRSAHGGYQEVKLEEICERYLCIRREEAYRQAARCELPFPVFKVGNSRKAPWMVDIFDLASVIDQAKAEAETLWPRCQV